MFYSIYILTTDCFTTDGAAMVACVAGGWLSGPILGNAVWRATHRSVRKEMERMDAVFLRHIRERRVDPSRQSVNNPVPDYCEQHDEEP